jgi:hypothetical protein
LERCSMTAPWHKPKARAEGGAALALGRIADGVEGGFSKVRLEGLSTKVLGGSCPTGPQALLVRGLRASNPWHRSAPPPCRPVAAARVRPGRRPGRGGSLRATCVVRVFSPRLTQRCPKASGSHPYLPECLEEGILRCSHRLGPMPIIPARRILATPRRVLRGFHAHSSLMCPCGRPKRRLT